MADGGRGLVVITGASTGIGRACALHLDGLGFDVLAGVRREADGERLRAEASGRLRPLHIDVTDEDAIRAAAEQAAEHAAGRGLAGLVNNAGVAVSGPLEFLPIAELRRQLEVNLIGHVAVTQALLPLLRAGRGRVVNMGSVGGRVVAPFIGPYTMSKFGIEAFSDSLRRELRPWGIQVSVVEPGSIATPIWDKGLSEAQRTIEQMPPEGRELYGDALRAVVATTEKTAAASIAPERVARAVAHALTARRSRPRYLVGRDARLQVVLSRLLPTRTFDGVMARFMGL